VKLALLRITTVLTQPYFVKENMASLSWDAFFGGGLALRKLNKKGCIMGKLKTNQE
jgi:hypothetical protein